MWLLALPRLLLKNTIVRSSKRSPSSFVCLQLGQEARATVFIFSSSTVLSCAILLGSWPWCDRS